MKDAAYGSHHNRAECWCGVDHDLERRIADRRSKKDGVGLTRECHVCGGLVSIRFGILARHLTHDPIGRRRVCLGSGQSYRPTIAEARANAQGSRP